MVEASQRVIPLYLVCVCIVISARCVPPERCCSHATDQTLLLWEWVFTFVCVCVDIMGLGVPLAVGHLDAAGGPHIRMGAINEGDTTWETLGPKRLGNSLGMA